MTDGRPVGRWAGVHCEECGREDDSEERGWKAYLVDGDAGDEEVVIFCPACSEQEFGGCN